jgi:hypothetical protein
MLTLPPGLNPALDKFGYYRVNNKNYYNKNHAYLEHFKSNRSVDFIFNEPVFDSYDWTVEPEPQVGLLEFYKRRALHLRNKYDYLILMHSGGPDSTNMFETFVNNNILVDEIVNINSYDQTDRYKDTVHNADYLLNLKPTIEEAIKHHNLKIKITIVDEIDTTRKYIRDTVGKDYENVYGSVMNISGFIYTGGWLKYVPSIWNRIARGENVGIVFGADKPSMFVVNGKYAMKHVDLGKIDYAKTFDSDPAYHGLDVFETFYSSPEDVLLQIKQAHVLKRFVEENVSSELYVDNEERSRKSRPPYNCQSKNHPGQVLQYVPYHKTIYPNWSPNIVTPKQINLMVRDDEFWAKGLDPNDLAIWLKVAQKFKQDFGHAVSQYHKFLPVIWGKPYFLE